MAEDAQNFQNHVRKLPVYYQLAGLTLAINILWSGYRLVGHLSGDTVVTFLLSLALLIISVSARTQTLTVQNRVIRLEERLRFDELLAPDVAARAAKLPVEQLVSLRFASDAELPDLVNAVLSGQVSAPKEIKQKVKDWQGDSLRA